MDDVFAIQRLVQAYADAACHRDGAAMAATFAADGELGGMARMAGLDVDRISGLGPLKDFFAGLMANVELVFQNAQLGAVTITGDEATADVMITEFARYPGQPMSIFLGRYQDRLVRTPAGWRFAMRELKPAALFQAEGQLTSFSG